MTLDFSPGAVNRMDQEVMGWREDMESDSGLAMRIPIVSNYGYRASRDYCEQIGLKWLGPDFIRGMDSDAHVLGCTQQMVDAGMRHALWHIKTLFTPQNYKWPQRFMIALYFLTGWKPR